MYFEVREKSGNCVSIQENSKFYLKVSEKSGNFTFGLHLEKEIKVIKKFPVCPLRALERFSYECRKTKTKAITLANHKRRK